MIARIEELMEYETAGDPITGLKWTRKTTEKIAEELKKDSLFTKVDVAGPGFINVFVEQNFYSKILEDMVSDSDGYLKEELGDPSNKKIVIEYSSPNIAKPLGAHHLLSTVIGDALKHIYKRCGYQVVAENYPGDIGTQFGKLMVAIEKWLFESM